MSEAVTYADLRFVELEMKSFDDLVETDVEDGEAMYENVSGAAPPRSRTKPPERPAAPEEPLRTGLWARTSLLSLLHLLLSLMLVASTIGLVVKYMDVSHQFHHLSVSHTEVTQRLQRKEKDLAAAENILESIRGETKEMVWHLNTSLLAYQWTSKESTDEKVQLVRDKEVLNTSLLQCQRTAKESTDEKVQLVRDNEVLNTSLLQCQRTARESTHEMERRLQNVTAQMEKLQKDLCPDGWILFGRKCLFISEEMKSWEGSQGYCEVEGANLLVAERDDAVMKAFSINNKVNFWVGKMLKRGLNKKSWEWPNSLEMRESFLCWMISEGSFRQDYCQRSEQRFICEKNLVVPSLEKPYSYTDYYNYFSFSLWDMNYKCKIV
ncbi:B-cell differentiation antigen CD72-like [Eleutherodactylus coqui]|uniref:B-cell differentiation antigen CD72-like n=1 Tax=Eleutherodactylus coqui TaxID=57060 RepID=UPI003461C05C